MLSLGDAEIDPYSFTQALLRDACAQGVRVFQGTKIQRLDASGNRVVVVADSGQIECRNVVLATGYSAKPFVPDSFADLQTTYVACSEPLRPIPGWSDRCLIWETARPYFYARQTSDGRVIVGGEDTSFADDHRQPAMRARKSKRLTRRFQVLFPHMSFVPAFTWAGTFAETNDGLPLIGPRQGNGRLHFALGYGGNGITFSIIAASLLRDLILGRPNSDAAVFGFSRLDC